MIRWFNHQAICDIISFKGKIKIAPKKNDYANHAKRKLLL